MIKAWSKDPQVKISDSETGSLFDALEDMSAQECCDKALTLAGLNSGKVAAVSNQAFVFVKPHAANAKVAAVVEEELKKRGIEILTQGEITAEQIDEKKLIDEHYYAIASKATLLTPDELAVPADKFETKFGVSWASVLADGLAYNAIDGGKKLGMDATQLELAWRDAKKKFDACIKFGGGFYCSKIQDIYIFNGFFMSMRAKYVAPGKKIIYYSISWNPNECSWEDFRGKVLGPTNPADAPADSIRGMVYAGWEGLGLEAQPDTGDNGVHASASPFEGLAERVNWLGATVESDPYGAALIAAGVPAEMIKTWSKDPQVKTSDSEKGSLFDALEDIDAQVCIDKAVMLAGLQ